MIIGAVGSCTIEIKSNIGWMILSIASGSHFGAKIPLLQEWGWPSSVRAQLASAACLLAAAWLADVVHELGHAIAAIYAGEKVTRFYLGMSSGIETCGSKSISHAKRAGIAIAGVLSNLIFVTVILAVLYLIEPTGYVRQFLLWSIFVGGTQIVNLLPILPLDGGVALRHFLKSRSSS
jgi:membrane-associated protease RseP (regulator of RpoE activity)